VESCDGRRDSYQNKKEREGKKAAFMKEKKSTSKGEGAEGAALRNQCDV